MTEQELEEHIETKAETQAKYSAVLRPESRALRDSFLESFNKHYKIGKLYSHSGGVLYEGKTATEWMQSFLIIPRGKANLDTDDLKSLFLKLAEAYHRASSFHANLFIAAEKLESAIDEREADFIKTELAKYKRGGEYWDQTAGKLTEKRPGKEVLEKIAQNCTVELRRALRDLKMEVSFFQHILADLEAQRRCFKDHSELCLAEMRTLNFSGG